MPKLPKCRLIPKLLEFGNHVRYSIFVVLPSRALDITTTSPRASARARSLTKPSTRLPLPQVVPWVDLRRTSVCLERHNALSSWSPKQLVMWLFRFVSSLILILMARKRAMAQSSRQERPATPTEPLPPGVDDSVPPPCPRRSLRHRNASARDVVAGPEGVAPPPSLPRRSLRVQARANASARDAPPSADGAPPEVSEFPCSLLCLVTTTMLLVFMMVSLILQIISLICLMNSSTNGILVDSDSPLSRTLPRRKVGPLTP